MEARLQRRIQRYGWDKSAAYYEQCWAERLAPVQRRLLDIATLLPGERVLDVACGTGLVTFPAAAAVGPSGEVVGTDISEEMVRLGQSAASERGISNVRFERMDAEDLRLPDASFDAVLCSLGLMYVPEPEHAMAEMRRLLRPGGRAVAAVWGRRDRCGWAEIFPIVDHRVESEVCPLFCRLGTGETLAHAFRDAGFADVQSERLCVALSFGDDEEACNAAFIGGPVALAYNRFDEETRAAVHAEYLTSLAPYRDCDAYHVPGEFVIVSGRV